MHALIIEDEHFIAYSIEDVLREYGFKSFDVAASAQRAIDAAARRRPDLITSDVQLKSGMRYHRGGGHLRKTFHPRCFYHR